MYADGTFETERHHEEDDESMSEETEGEEEDRRTCQKHWADFWRMFISDKDIAEVNT